MRRFYTAESVTEGHPDKLCDLIADSILDDCLKQDSEAKVACEVLATKGHILIAGEITSRYEPFVFWTAKEVLEKIGYPAGEIEMESHLHHQSPDIAGAAGNSFEKRKGLPKKSSEFEYGAGDQGVMIGYACDETPQKMPLPVVLANRITAELSACRKSQYILGILPDGKAQVTVEYMDAAYGDDKNPLIEKSEFILSLFEQLVGAGNLSAKEKSILDRCTADVYREYIRSGFRGRVPTLKDLYRELMAQPEEEARGLALSSELFINGSLNTFAQPTNVDTKSRIIDYDIRELGEQLMPLGMLVTLDSIFNRVIQNWKKGKTTWIFADEFYLLFQYQYSADFFYRLYKRIRKYYGFVTGLTQNCEELLKSDTARLMLANSEFLVLLNQASTDREELAKLLNISDNQLSYITNVGAGHGLIRCSGNLVPFENTFPKNTKLFELMSTSAGDF